ncbi:PREDICTED: bombyxin B-5-like [Vollenhovia emeryi]|uniref:bombyxin B-5-like n=1 Tax=Vollenhovia emeryi TaxID=411798 RepID=UPI0005F449B5|nr:PREDICTED: bombyxin B-5-like [Vollenhovia emeryi]
MTVLANRALNGAVLLVALVFFNVLYAIDAQVIYKKSHVRMQKLCSRKLSDALYTVCRERGYNEPYNDEDELETDPGPGLVEECCYHYCTIEQLEQYCKPLPDGKQDSNYEIVASYVANLPHSTIKDVMVQTERGNTGDAIKRYTEYSQQH